MSYKSGQEEMIPREFLCHHYPLFCSRLIVRTPWVGLGSSFRKQLYIQLAIVNLHKDRAKESA